MKSKRPKRLIGDIGRIDLGDGFHGYTRVLKEALFAFYDCRVRNELPVDQIIVSSVLFIVPVVWIATWLSNPKGSRRRTLIACAFTGIWVA